MASFILGEARRGKRKDDEYDEDDDEDEEDSDGITDGDEEEDLSEESTFTEDDDFIVLSKKEKEKKRKVADRIRLKEIARKAVERGKSNAAKKIDIKPTVIKTQPVKPINMNPPKPKPIVKKEMVKDIPVQPIMKPNAYVTVHTIKSAGVNKYPVTWKTAASAKYGRLWFATLNEAEQLVWQLVRFLD